MDEMLNLLCLMLVGWKLKLGHLVDMLELGQLGNIFDGFQLSTSESTSSYLVLLFYILTSKYQ